MPQPRRSPFADLLRDYPDFAFGDTDVFARRSQWHAYFRDRIGTRFADRLILEIGSFTADLLTTVASVHPTTAFVGLDWKAKAIHTAAARVHSLELRNVALLRGRAQHLPRIVAPSELDEIWIFHPDPCDQPQELRNRLFAEPFLLDAHAALKPGGGLVLKTDHPGYYQHALALLDLPQPPWFAEALSLGRHRTASPRVRWRDLVSDSTLPSPSRPVLARFDVDAHSADFWADDELQRRLAHREFYGQTTTFEARFRKKNLPIYYLELRRR